MPETGLDRARVVAVAGELVAAGMAKHVRGRLDVDNGCRSSVRETDNTRGQMPL